MYLHLGENKVVKKRDIIGIFDMDTATVMKATRTFLNNAEKTALLRLCPMSCLNPLPLSAKGVHGRKKSTFRKLHLLHCKSAVKINFKKLKTNEFFKGS